MAAILLTATRFRGENGYAAAIIVLPNVPVYVYNMSRMLGWHDLTLFMFPICFSVNTLLMPLLWFFAKKNFDTSFRLKPIHLLHLLPGLVCLIITLSLSREEVMASILHEMAGDDTWVGDFNASIVFVQMVVYFTVIFRFLHRKKKEIRDTASDAEWVQKEWIPTFEYLFAALFVIVMVCYAIWPRTDAWLPQLLNVVAMVYLLYSELDIAFSSRLREVPASEVVVEAKAEFTAVAEKPQAEANTDTETRKDDLEQLQQYARQVEDYLRTSEAYVNPNLSLKEVAKAVGISSNNLSKAINATLDKNFFDLVNGFRVEKSKALLLAKREKGFTLETIAEQCGFNSQVTYCNAFKKAIGMTTTQWLKLFKE